jgi:putative copper export protein
MSASFALVSIASDLRYHLWSMVAAALALVLLIDARALERRRTIVAGAAVLALMAVASLGHIGLARDVSQPQPVFVPPPGTKS